ncbi:MAG: L-rhamnose mutarotase [Eubacteriales bacterium]|nr:L-rhamnose mutarotase [Eubacteriales bacterium]
MVRKAFKMFLYPGQEAEYERRHNLLWPEMKEMIHQYGGRNYSIYLDRENHVLYGYLEVEDEARWAESADTAINRKWWDYMADIMETNPDNSPVCVDLVPVFHLN